MRRRIILEKNSIKLNVLSYIPLYPKISPILISVSFPMNKEYIIIRFVFSFLILYFSSSIDSDYILALTSDTCKMKKNIIINFIAKNTESNVSKVTYATPISELFFIIMIE